MLQWLIRMIRRVICFFIFESHCGRVISRKKVHIPEMIHGGWQGQHVEEEHDCDVIKYKCIICGETWEEYIKIDEKESE